MKSSFHPVAAVIAVALLGIAPLARAADAAVAVPAQRTQPTTTVPSDDNFRRRIGYQISYSDYLAAKRGRAVDLIFIGDSITEMWRWSTGWEVWLRHFENRALNFGLGSDRTEHVLWRLQNIRLTEWAPKVAVVLIGTNNVRDTPEDIAAGVRAVVDETRARFTDIKVIVVSILPNARANEKMAAANKLIATMADGKTVFYLDLASKFPRDEENNNWKGLAGDKLHLSAEGYETWAQAVEAMLPELLK